MTFTIRPLPWKEVHRDHWQAVTSLGTWDVFYCYIACIDAQRWNWRLTTLDGEAIIECGFCEGLEDGVRLAEEARNRLITPELEPVEDEEFIGILNHLIHCTKLEIELGHAPELRTSPKARLKWLEAALARHKAGKPNQ